MNGTEAVVLTVLADMSEPDGGVCLSFAPIMRAANLDRAVVRRACRSLARKGLAEFHSPLWNDGDPAGAGYCISRAGLDQVERAEERARR